MNNARMWTVVNPTVGLPLFFVGVAATSLIVHASIMTNSDFMGKFWSGQEMDSASLSLFDPTQNAAAPSTVAANLQSGEAFIVLPDGRTGRVIFDAPVTLASADGEKPLSVD